jgi:hypothetical protein
MWGPRGRLPLWDSKPLLVFSSEQAGEEPTQRARRRQRGASSLTRPSVQLGQAQIALASTDHSVVIGTISAPSANHPLGLDQGVDCIRATR